MKISLRLGMDIMGFDWNTKKELLGKKGKGFVCKISKNEILGIDEPTLKTLREKIRRGEFCVC